MRTIAILLLSSVALEAQVLKPGENLVVDGVPAIPVSVAQKLHRYSESRSAGLLDWHPTKREMLISTRFGQTAQVHHVKMPGGARTQLTFFPERVSGAKYSKDGSFFVFSRDVGGNERYQNYRFDISTGEITLLTDGKSRNSSGLWSHDGKLMAYTSTRKNGTTNDLYIIDPKEPKSDRFVCELGVGWGVSDWSHDGLRLLALEYVSVNESHLWLIDAGTGRKTAFTTRGKEKVAYGGGKFTKDDKSILTTTDKGSEFRRLVRMEIESGKFTVLTGDTHWDVEQFDLSPDQTHVSYIINENGIGRLHVMDLSSMAIVADGTGVPGTITSAEWRPGSLELAIGATSAQSPNDIYSLDIKSRKIERWTESETGGLNTSRFSEPELVKWKSFDEREISGFLYKPAAKFSGKRPVIVIIHGGPEGQARPRYLGSLNYYTQELGVAILYPNIRGSSGFGKTYLQLDNGFKREDSYKDINALFDWIKSRPDLDADRVMVTGGSYGGHMTLAIATYYPDRIRCAVDIVGMSNLRTFLENTESYRRDLRRAEYGDERDPKMRDFMEKTAPLNNVGKISKPLFVIQGLNDPRVPASEAEQMVKALKGGRVPVWYLLAKDEGHGFAKQANREYQDAATVRFVLKYLLEEEVRIKDATE